MDHGDGQEAQIFGEAGICVVLRLNPVRWQRKLAGAGINLSFESSPRGEENSSEPQRLQDPTIRISAKEMHTSLIEAGMTLSAVYSRMRYGGDEEWGRDKFDLILQYGVGLSVMQDLSEEAQGLIFQEILSGLCFAYSFWWRNAEAGGKDSIMFLCSEPPPLRLGIANFRYDPQGGIVWDIDPPKKKKQTGE